MNASLNIHQVDKVKSSRIRNGNLKPGRNYYARSITITDKIGKTIEITLFADERHKLKL